jgi:type I restriction enzyme M protein
LVDDSETYLERAISDGHAEIAIEGKTERIRYVAADRSERWSDPEEKVRAEFWAELIYKYEYPARRIGFEVKVPSGSNLTLGARGALRR